jgi:P27 family predicted phage terminase small subunit
MGRKAKPAYLQALEGNKSKKSAAELLERHEKEQSLKGNADEVRPPSWMRNDAKNIFRELVKELETVDLISNVDVNSLARYSETMNEYTNRIAEKEEQPFTIDGKANTFYSHLRKLESELRAMDTEFGLSPSARAKLAVPQKEKKELTEFEQKFGDV